MPREGLLYKKLSALREISPKMGGWVQVRRSDTGDDHPFTGLLVAQFRMGSGRGSKRRIYHLFILSHLPALALEEDLMFGLVGDDIKWHGDPYHYIASMYDVTDMEVFNLDGLIQRLQPQAFVVLAGLKCRLDEYLAQAREVATALRKVTR